MAVGFSLELSLFYDNNVFNSCVYNNRTLDNSQIHKSLTDQWKPKIIFLRRFKYMPREIANCNFVSFPHVFLYKIVLILYMIVFYTSSSHFSSDKPRTAHSFWQKGGGMWIWLTIICKCMVEWLLHIVRHIYSCTANVKVCSLSFLPGPLSFLSY